MKYHPRVLAIILLFSSGAFAQNYTPVFTESEASLFKIKEGQEYTFGYLEVPENRENTAGKWIRLPVYIFKSRNPNPAPDPIIYTVGGPGSTTMPSAQYMAYYSYLDDRDFILFEQRGTAYAQPALDCPEWATAQYQANSSQFTQSKKDQLLAEAAQKCRDKLIREDIDLNQYRTSASAADIADLRKALKIKEYNLLTISYSTKIAQVLLRDYPEGIRSVVMDSALPLEVQYDEESVENSHMILQLILDDCAQDPDCNQAYPQLKERWEQLLQIVAEKPIEIEVKLSQKQEPEIFRLDDQDFRSMLAGASTAEIPYLPGLIDQVLQGNFSPVKDWLQGRLSGLGSGQGIGMRLSVWCAEETPFNTDSFSGRGAVFSEDICEIWSVSPAKVVDNQPVKSDIPVLFINGSYDQETPAKWARQMLPNFPNGQQLIFSGWRHTPTTNWGNPCAMEAARAFYAMPFSSIKLNCQENINGVKFITK